MAATALAAQLPQKRRDQACTCPTALHHYATMVKLPSGKYVEIRMSERLDDADVLDLVDHLDQVIHSG